jgi:uncharacterized protein YggU (UPF0235/DUF167 family)
VLGVRKGRVSLDKGSRSRYKRVLVEDASREEVLAKITQGLSG